MAAPGRVILARQAASAGPLEGGVGWLQCWINTGAPHLAVRFAGGDQLAQVDEAAAPQGLISARTTIAVTTR